MPEPRIFTMPFARVYPLYVQKAERKGRTRAEVDRVIGWLTGYDAPALRQALEEEVDLRTFFARAPAMNPHRALVTGVVCGVRVEAVEDPLMQSIRQLDKLVDELARGRPLARILRGPDAAPRVDTTSRLVEAPPAAVFRAFAEPEALERWLPPAGMTGTLLRFDFRSGGAYRMRLTYPEGARGPGGTSADEVEVRLPRVEDGRAIEQAVTFVSDDPARAGEMRLTWTFDPVGATTLVVVRAERVPEGIRPEDHRAAIDTSLDQLAAFVEARARGEAIRPRRLYHGTKADLRPGDTIEPGHGSNYGARRRAGWVYLSATLDAATWGAELALGDGPGRIYVVEPSGPVEDDPNLTDQRFPGNPTRSYRSRHPLRVIDEVTGWRGHAPEQLRAMRESLERLQRLGVEAIED